MKKADDKSVLQKLLTLITNNRWLILGICGIIILSTLIVAIIFNRPIADDYAFFARHNANNPFYMSWFYYFEENGRASHGFFTSLMYMLFGDKSVVFGAVLLIISLIISYSWLVNNIQSKIIDKKVNNKLSVISGIVLTVVTIMSAYSIFDSYLWLTSSYVYVTGIIGTIIVLVLTIKLFTKKHIHWYEWLLFSLSIIISAFFNEITSIYLCGLFLMTLVIFAIIKNAKVIKLKETTKHNIRVLSIGFIISTICLLALVFSPGSNRRREASNLGLDLYTILIVPLSQIKKMSYLFTPSRLLLITSISIMCATIMPKINNKQRLFISLTALVIILGFNYVFFVIMGYAQNGYIAQRAYVIPGLVTMCGVAVIFATLLQPLISRFVNISSVLAIVCIVLSTIGITRMLSSIIQATVLRHDMYTTRELEIRNQLDKKSGVVKIMPLPILLNKSEAQDLAYNYANEKWVENAFKYYYRIPISTKIVLEEQAAGYCTNDYNETPYYFGAKTCSELVKDY